MLPKNILITGASGLIGQQLILSLKGKSCLLTCLTRDVEKARLRLGNDVNYLPSLVDLKNLNEFDAVINLAGEPIADKRWSAEQKQRLQHSRWDITGKLTQLICASDSPPSVFISGSAVGYYGNKGNEVLIETSTPNINFLNQLCQQWEFLAQQAGSEKTRVCLLRTGLVLSPRGGILKKILPLFKLGLGGKLGSGEQYMSWIHIHDMVKGIIFLLERDTLSGPFNMTAPEPIDNKVFTQTLGQLLKRPTFLSIPSTGLEILLGELSTMLLESQRALPDKLHDAGFIFDYPTLQVALKNILFSNYHK